MNTQNTKKDCDLPSSFEGEDLEILRSETIGLGILLAVVMATMFAAYLYEIWRVVKGGAE